MNEPAKPAPVADLVFAVVFWLLVAGMLALFALIAVQNWRMMPRSSPAHTCINHLRQIDGAKQQWALEHHQGPNDIPTRGDLAGYFKSGTLPVCPAHGTYTIGPVNADPTCSIPGHVLPVLQSQGPSASHRL